MATGRKRIRHTLDFNFVSVEVKEAFKARFNEIRDRLSPANGNKLDNLGVMTALFEMVDSGCNMDTNPVGELQSGTVSADNRTSFMDSSG